MGGPKVKLLEPPGLSVACPADVLTVTMTTPSTATDGAVATRSVASSTVVLTGTGGAVLKVTCAPGTKPVPLMVTWVVVELSGAPSGEIEVNVGTP